jgi:DNA invertase Pin-like site-specific DNA recombinase
MKRIGLYLRCSTTEQNVGLQRDDLQRLCTTRFQDAQITEYVDQGQSGAKQSRPALNRLLADMRKGKLDIIAVWRFDRLGRSLRHLVELLEEFRARNVQFISYSEGADTSTPTGQLLFNLCASFAEFERQLIRERVIAGQRAAKRRGVRFGRPTVAVDAAKVQELRADGLSWRAIAAQLGVPKDTLIRHSACQ